MLYSVHIIGFFGDIPIGSILLFNMYMFGEACHNEYLPHLDAWCKL